MGQEELEGIVLQGNCDIAAITATWWDDSHNWSAAIVAEEIGKVQEVVEWPSILGMYMKLDK